LSGVAVGGDGMAGVENRAAFPPKNRQFGMRDVVFEILKALFWDVPMYTDL
jgi:hypothetical protein